MKKVLLFLFLILFLCFPYLVNAKEYDSRVFNDSVEFTPENRIDILHPGDTINFSQDSRDIKIYVDREMVFSCDEGQCPDSYEIEETLVMFDVYGGNTYCTIDLVSVSDDAQLYFYGLDLEEGKLYRSGDVVSFPKYTYSSYYYDEEEYYVGESHGYTHIIPQYEDQDAYWLLELAEDGNYAPIVALFKVYPYTPPTFDIKCEQKSIQYGEKTKCAVYVSSIEQLSKVTYNLDVPNFKVSNVVAGEHTTPFEGQNEYNYIIDAGYAVNGEEFVLMTFDLEGTKNESYLDNISIVGISYQDNVYSGEYDNVVSDLRVVPGAPKNPNTWNNLIYVFIPFITLLVAAFYRKKKRVS